MEISNVFDVSISEKWDPMPGTFGGTQDRDPRPMSEVGPRTLNLGFKTQDLGNFSTLEPDIQVSF